MTLKLGLIIETVPIRPVKTFDHRDHHFRARKTDFITEIFKKKPVWLLSEE